MQTHQYKYLDTYLDELRSKGRYSFTASDLRSRFSLSAEALKKSLQRITKNKEAVRVRQEFYVIVPPEYRSKGILPTSFFISDLMKFLQKDYYVGLLTAASFYGAAHQQPQEFYVITQKPTLRNIQSSKLKINFSYKKKWYQEDISERKVETGYIKVSSPELTALDLVTYFDKAGGMDRIATVLSELAEMIDKEKLILAARRYGNTASIQRLGYLLEIVEQSDLAEPLETQLKEMKHFSILLRPDKQRPLEITKANKWKIIENTQIDPDL